MFLAIGALLQAAVSAARGGDACPCLEHAADREVVVETSSSVLLCSQEYDLKSAGGRDAFRVAIEACGVPVDGIQRTDRGQLTVPGWPNVSVRSNWNRSAEPAAVVARLAVESVQARENEEIQRAKQFVDACIAEPSADQCNPESLRFDDERWSVPARTILQTAPSAGVTSAFQQYAVSSLACLDASKSKSSDVRQAALALQACERSEQLRIAWNKLYERYGAALAGRVEILNPETLERFRYHDPESIRRLRATLVQLQAKEKDMQDARAAIIAQRLKDKEETLVSAVNEIVRRQLRSPSTASLRDDVCLRAPGVEVSVLALRVVVDAQNSFGAYIRNEDLVRIFWYHAEDTFRIEHLGLQEPGFGLADACSRAAAAKGGGYPWQSMTLGL